MRAPLHYLPLYPEHLFKLRVHPVQTDEYNALLTDAALNNMATCTGVSGWAGERCIGIAGVYPLWDQRAEAFVLFAEDAKHYILQALPKIRYVLDAIPFRRVEMNVKAHNYKGHQLARHLGFGGRQKVELANGDVVQAEGYMEKFWPGNGEGVDVVMYARIKPS